MLSDTEKHHLTRVFCRLQIMSNIFGHVDALDETASTRCAFSSNDWYDIVAPGHLDPQQEADPLFWGTVSQWEYDEMGCVLHYMKRKYTHHYQAIRDNIIDLVERHVPKDWSGGDWFEDFPSELNFPDTRLPILQYLEDMHKLTYSITSMGPIIPLSLFTGGLYAET